MSSAHNSSASTSLGGSLSKSTLDRLAGLDSSDFTVLERLFSRGASGTQVFNMVHGAIALNNAVTESGGDSLNRGMELNRTITAFETLTVSPTTGSPPADRTNSPTNTSVVDSPSLGIAILGEGASRPSPVAPNPVPPPRADLGPTTNADVFPSPGTQSGSDFRNFIARNPSRYNKVFPDPIDTSKSGPTRYRVWLIDDIYACFPNPRGATQVAQIAYIHGIRHPMVEGRIYRIDCGGLVVQLRQSTGISTEAWLAYGMPIERRRT